jgi:hypothetical protein
MPPDAPKPAAAGRMTTLIDTGEVLATHIAGAGETLIVAMAPGAETLAWGGAFLAGLPSAAITISNPGYNWYPHAAMQAVLAAMRPILARHPRVIAYGYSMGAYGVLKYGAAMGAAVGIALSPQYSIEPALVGRFDPRRAREFYRPGLHDGMAIRAADVPKRAILFRDPNDACDAAHAALIAAQAPVDIVGCPGIAHQSIDFLIECGLLRRFINDLAADPALPAARLRAAIRAARCDSGEYLQALAARQRQRGHRAESLATLRRALTVRTLRSATRLAIIEGLFAHGLSPERLEEAAMLLGGGTRKPGELADLWIKLADTHERAGHPAASVAATRKAIDHAPAALWLRDRLVHRLIDAGQPAEARAQIAALAAEAEALPEDWLRNSLASACARLERDAS